MTYFCHVFTITDTGRDGRKDTEKGICTVYGLFLGTELTLKAYLAQANYYKLYLRSSGVIGSYQRFGSIFRGEAIFLNFFFPKEKLPGGECRPLTSIQCQG